MATNLCFVFVMFNKIESIFFTTNSKKTIKRSCNSLVKEQKFQLHIFGHRHRQIRRHQHIGDCNVAAAARREHEIEGVSGRQCPHTVLLHSIYCKRHCAIGSAQCQYSGEWTSSSTDTMHCECAIIPVIIAVDTSPYRTVVEFRVMVVVVPMNIVVQRVRRCDCSYKPPRFACQSNGDDSTARQRSNKHWSRCREATKTISAGKHAINDRAEMTINQGECLRACKT